MVKCYSFKGKLIQGLSACYNMPWLIQLVILFNPRENAKYNNSE